MTTNAPKITKKPLAAKAAKPLDPKKLLLDEPSILAAIKSLDNRGKSLQKDMHIIACSVLQHLARHSDVRVVEKLVNGMLEAMPSMARTNALRNWFEMFGMVEFEGNKALFAKDKKNNLEAALKKPFWTIKGNEGATYVPLVADTYVDQQIARLEKDQKNGGHEKFAALIVNLKDYKATLAQAA